MSKYLVRGETLTAVANAIRNKTGKTGAITLNDFVTEIEQVDYREVIDTVPSITGSLTYNGSEQSPTILAYNPDQLMMTGISSATNAGTYEIAFSPKDGYKWADDTTTAKVVEWSIAKAFGSLSLSATSGKIIGKSNNTATFTVTRTGDGAISVQSSNTSIATATVSGTTVTVTSKAYGSATITVSVAEDANYTAPSSKTYSVTVDYLYLFNAGDENTSVTGGWQARGWRGSSAVSTGTAPTITKSNGTMAIAFAAGAAGVAEPKKDINFKGFETIYCRITKIANGSDPFSKARLSIVSRSATYYITNSVTNVTIGSTGTVSINISGLSSTTSYDVVIGGAGRGTGSSAYTVTVDKIWCE